MGLNGDREMVKHVSLQQGGALLASGILYVHYCVDGMMSRMNPNGDCASILNVALQLNSCS